MKPRGAGNSKRGETLREERRRTRLGDRGDGCRDSEDGGGEESHIV